MFGMNTAILGLIWAGSLTLGPIDWPQWRGHNRDGVWRETGIVQRFDRPQLQPRWRTPIGPGYAGPAVANGRVYVTDRNRKKGTSNTIAAPVAHPPYMKEKSIPSAPWAICSA